MYIANNPDDEDKIEQEKKRAEDASVFKPAATQDLKSGGSSKAPASSDNKGSGLFTNLDSFINANRGKSEQFAGNVAGSLGTKQDEALGTVQGETDAFKNSVKGNSDNGLLGKATSNPGSLSSDESAMIKKNLEGGYDGPESFVSNEGLSKVNEAKELSKNALTDAGRAKVLGDFYDSRKQAASGGEMSFDNLLLNRDEKSKAIFNDMANRADTVALDAQKLVTNANQNVTDTKQKNKDLADNYRNTLSTALSDEDKIIQDTIKAANDQQETDYRNAVAANGIGVEGVDKYNGSIDRPDGSIKAFGYEGWDGQSISGDNFVSRGDANDWRSSLSPEQQAKYNALASFLGKDQLLGDLQARRGISVNTGLKAQKQQELYDAKAQREANRQAIIDQMNAEKAAIVNTDVEDRPLPTTPTPAPSDDGNQPALGDKWGREIEAGLNSVGSFAKDPAGSTTKATNKVLKKLKLK